MIAKYVEKLLGRRLDSMTHRNVRVGASIEQAIADIAAGKAGRRGRRRGPRERGRPHLRRRAGHAGADRVHGALHLRLHLRAADRGGGRPARAAADVPHQPGPPRHRVHGDGRRAGRRHRPASPPPTGRTPSGCSPPRTPDAADLSRPGHVVPLRAKDGRRAAPARAHRGGGRPGRAGRTAPGRRALRDGQRRRHHAAPAGPREVRRGARPDADHRSPT